MAYLVGWKKSSSGHKDLRASRRAYLAKFTRRLTGRREEWRNIHTRKCGAPREPGPPPSDETTPAPRRTAAQTLERETGRRQKHTRACTHTAVAASIAVCHRRGRRGIVVVDPLGVPAAPARPLSANGTHSRAAAAAEYEL